MSPQQQQDHEQLVFKKRAPLTDLRVPFANTVQAPALGSLASPSAKRAKVITIRTSHTKSDASGQLDEDGDPPSAGVEAAVQTDRNEEELAREKIRVLEERLDHYQEELATERAKSRSLEERVEDRLAALERLAAEPGEASIFPGLERECVNLGKKIERASIATSSDKDVMTDVIEVVAFNPLDENGEPTISLKRRRDIEATIFALCAVGISTGGFLLSMKLTSDQAKSVTANANVIIDAVATKIDGFPLASDSVDDLKKKVAAKVLQKDLISNTKKRGLKVWETNEDPQSAPNGALMMHRKMKDALKEFGFPFDSETEAVFT